MKFKPAAGGMPLIGLLMVAMGAAWQCMGDDAAVQDFSDVEVKQFKPEKDPKTGFVTGGKNATSLIEGLTEINGRPIAALEKDMRPGAYSTKGFLGADERLLDILAEDNRYVVGELGLNHQQIAGHLRALGEIAKKTGGEFRYHGRRFKASLQLARGYQPSPFKDGTQTNVFVSVQNLDKNLKLEYSLLLPDLIERYGFYEGKGTPYRIEPRKIVEFFDFLKRP
jgi:hypothetical protein